MQTNLMTLRAIVAKTSAEGRLNCDRRRDGNFRCERCSTLLPSRAIESCGGRIRWHFAKHVARS